MVESGEEWKAEWRTMITKYHTDNKAADPDGYQAWLESEAKRAEEMKAEEAKNKAMSDFQATFQAADTNSNGVLNQAEFVDFSKKMYSNLEAAGYAVLSISDEAFTEAYPILNKITPGTEGISPADMMAQVMYTKQIVAEINA